MPSKTATAYEKRINAVLMKVERSPRLRRIARLDYEAMLQREAIDRWLADVHAIDKALEIAAGARFDTLYSKHWEKKMPSKTAKQHRAMAAACHGKSNIGIPKKVGCEYTKADKAKGGKKGK